MMHLFPASLLHLKPNLSSSFYRPKNTCCYLKIIFESVIYIIWTINVLSCPPHQVAAPVCTTAVKLSVAELSDSIAWPVPT
jgi:hypothetical protein